MITEKRRLIAEEIIRRADTVTLLSSYEVADIYQCAAAGQYDDVFTDAELQEARDAQR